MPEFFIRSGLASAVWLRWRLLSGWSVILFGQTEQSRPRTFLLSVSVAL